MAHRRLEASCGPLLVDDDGSLIKARGIPYATAARFAAPELIAPQRNLRDATRRGPVCPQLPSRLEFVCGPTVSGLISDEQCQVLSVTAPRTGSGHPVMVWFHGGAYLSGSGEAPKYDADALVAEGNVVVVSVSYRLGIFGYLNPVADEENLGLRDQIEALRWVQRHIASFGGDPSQVTIFGQSAGGDAVSSLILSLGASGLFGRAILQSAPLGLRHGRTEMTAAMRTAVHATLRGIPPREASVDQLLDAQNSAVATASRYGALGGLPFAPIEGVAPLPARHRARRQLAEAAAGIEILVGYARHDAAPFVAMNPHGRRLRSLGRPGIGAARVLDKVFTARIFGRPAAELVRVWSSHGGAAATYRVDWFPPGAPLRACHCIELPLLFGSPTSWADAPMLGPARHRLDPDVARSVRRSWASFAHNGVAALDASPLII